MNDSKRKAFPHNRNVMLQCSAAVLLLSFLSTPLNAQSRDDSPPSPSLAQSGSESGDKLSSNRSNQAESTAGTSTDNLQEHAGQDSTANPEDRAGRPNATPEVAQAPAGRTTYQLRFDAFGTATLNGRKVTPKQAAEQLPAGASIVVTAPRHTPASKITEFESALTDDDKQFTLTLAVQDDAPTAHRAIRVYAVQNVSVVEVVKSLNSLAPNLSIEADPATNRILALASDTEHEAIEKVIARIDGEKPQITSIAADTRPGSLPHVLLQLEHTQLKLQLVTLENQFGPRHPRVVQIRRQINVLQEALDEIDRASAAPTDADVTDEQRSKSVPSNDANFAANIKDPPPLPTVDDLVNGRTFDWIVLKDGKVLVVQPLQPRPETFRQLTQRLQDFDAAAETFSGSQDERAKRRQELQRVKVTLTEDPQEEYVLSLQHIATIISFEDLLKQRVDELMADQRYAEAKALLDAADTTQTSAESADPLIGTWVLQRTQTMGADPNGWWGLNGVIDMTFIGRKGDLVIKPRTATQYDNTALWKRITDGRLRRIEFAPVDGSESQIAEYQLDGDHLIIRPMIQGNRGFRGPITMHYDRADPPLSIPKGMRVVTIPISPTNTSLPIQSGNRVDVLLTIGGPQSETAKTIGLMEFVEVFSVDNGSNRNDFSSKRNISVLTTREQAEVVVQARQHGVFSIVLRNSSVDGQSSCISSDELAEFVSGSVRTKADKTDTIPDDAGDGGLPPVSSATPASDLLDMATDQQQLSEELRQLEAERREAEIALQQAEDASIEAAERYRSRNAKEKKTPSPNGPQILQQSLSELTQAVEKAFNARWNLQAIRLRQSAAELRELQLRHARRSALSKRIIKRRVDDLISTEDLEWFQGRAEGQATVTDERLIGMWKLESISGLGITGSESGLQLRVDSDTWTMVRGNGESAYQLSLGTLNGQRTIDIKSANGVEDYRGIYKVDEDKLVIAWGSSKDAGYRPVDFSDNRASTHTWTRLSQKPVRSAEKGPNVPVFSDPHELLKFMVDCGRRRDYESYVTLLTDDAVDQFAGMLLYSCNMMNQMQTLAQASGTVDPATANEMEKMRAIAAVVARSTKQAPDPEAAAALARLSNSMMVLVVAAGSTNNAAASRLAQDIRVSAGVLKDKRAFCVSALQALDAMTGDSTVPAADATDFSLQIEGNSATAHFNPSADQSEHSTISFVKADGAWRISSIFDDGQLNAMTATPQLTLTESAQPVTVLKAKTTIGHLDALSADNVEVMAWPANRVPDDALRSLDEIKNKSARIVIPRGHMIRSSDLVKTPLHDDFLNLKLASAQEGTNIFAPFTRIDRDDPFSPISVKYRRDRIPHWAEAFIDRFNESLEADVSNGSISDGTMNALNSISYLMNAWGEDDSWDLEYTASLLYDLAETHAASENEHNRSTVQSERILSLIARGLGEIPEVVSTAPLPNPAVERKWRLLNQLLVDDANDGGISREHVRLRNLVREAPWRTIQSLVSTGSVKPPDTAAHWMSVLSTETVFAAWSSSPRKMSEPPIDPLLLAMILESMAGQSEAVDDRISSIVNDAHPSHLFGCHVRDILSGKLFYREFLHQSLVSMYRKAKSESLRQAIEHVAQGPAAQAKRSMTGSPTGADRTTEANESGDPTAAESKSLKVNAARVRTLVERFERAMTGSEKGDLDELLTKDATWQGTKPLRLMLSSTPPAKAFPPDSTLHWLPADRASSALVSLKIPRETIRKGTVLVYRNVNDVGDKTFRLLYWLEPQDESFRIYRLDDGRMPTTALSRESLPLSTGSED